MSLRFFHIIFITISTLLCLGIAGWEYASFRATSGTAHLVGASVWALAGITLLAYGIWFLRKTRKLIL